MAPVSFKSDSKTHRHWLALSLLLILFVGLCVISLFVGSRLIAPFETFKALFHTDLSNDAHLVIIKLRLPRCLTALLAGAALGISGLVIQVMTRNPLAEPGLIGINAGAALAVLGAATMFGLTSMIAYVWFGLAGAGIAGIVVFLLSRSLSHHNSPLHLILSGVGVTIVLSSITGLVLVNSSPLVFDQFRHWSAGSVEGRGYDVLSVLAVCVVGGITVAGFLARQLNIIVLGSDVARLLGVKLYRTWILALITVMLLSGSATAAVGPVGFIGLIAPHLARMFFGTDYRWLLPSSAVIAGLLLLCADIFGRVIAIPNEVPAGILALLMGGPFFIYVVWRYKLVET